MGSPEVEECRAVVVMGESVAVLTVSDDFLCAGVFICLKHIPNC